MVQERTESPCIGTSKEKDLPKGDLGRENGLVGIGRTARVTFIPTESFRRTKGVWVTQPRETTWKSVQDYKNKHIVRSEFITKQFQKGVI